MPGEESELRLVHCDSVAIEEMTLEQALELVVSTAFVTKYQAATVVGRTSGQIDFYETGEQADAQWPMRIIKVTEKNGVDEVMRAWANAGADHERAKFEADKPARTAVAEGSNFFTIAFMTFIARLKDPSSPEENVIALAVTFCEIFQKIEDSADRILTIVATHRPEILEQVRSQFAA